MAVQNQVIEVETKSLTTSYQPVELDFITLDSICDYNLYLKLNGQYVLYRGAHTPFTVQDKERLQQSKNTVLFINCQSEGELRRFYEQNLSNIIDSTIIPVKEKADVLLSVRERNHARHFS